jgi:hypothetical protein
VAYLMAPVVFQHCRKKRKYSKGTLDIRAENWSNIYWSLPGSVVGVSTAYGLDGPGIESRDADPSPPSSTEVKNRVELYLYSP